MKKLFTLLLLVNIALFFSCSKAQKHAKKTTETKPNIIIVITDDQGYGDLGHTGNPIIKTPAMDLFASQSINLTNYHVGTTCAPTRAGLLTGRNCNRNGVWHTIMGASILNEDETTLADIFKENAYSTGMFGKWHLGDNDPYLPHQRGFEEAFYHGGGGVGQTPDYWKNDYFDDTYFRNGVPEKKEGYCTDIWFEEAIKFIEKNKEQQFFCYLSLNAPHSPFNVPESYYNKYKNESAISETQKRFYGMISNIDDNFSKLLGKLKEFGIDKNTIVLFTTDNGTSAGYWLDKNTNKYLGYNAGMRGKKASEYEGGHRVPMIIRWPEGRLIGGKKLNGLSAHVDILPTLLKLVGIPFTAQKKMDGQDISDYLLGKKESPERMLVTDTQRVPWPIKGKQFCVMSGDWRLINEKELYNIAKDPSQENNIAEANPDRVAKMNAFYNDWWEDVLKETKYSRIHIGANSSDVLTCHDAHTTDYYPPWNQQLIRKGKPMPPAPFYVKFVKDGTYRFYLRRWPKESALALGSESSDVVKASPYTDKQILGESMKFKKAILKIGDQIIETKANNEKDAAILEMQVPSGEKEILAYFLMEDDTECNAFYIDIEKIN